MTEFETLQNIIRSRRSSKPALMNGKKIDDTIIHQLLELADWAPTHAHTEPWRFVVYGGDKAQQFCKEHADLYKSITPEDKFNTSKYEKILHNGDKVSHIITIIMKRNVEHKIPAIEEISAVSCAVQNILLGAETLGIAVLWSTGGLAHHEAMKKYFSMNEEDMVLGFLYLGYSDEAPKEGKRIIPLNEKIKWVE